LSNGISSHEMNKVQSKTCLSAPSFASIVAKTFVPNICLDRPYHIKIISLLWWQMMATSIFLVMQCFPSQRLRILSP